MNGRVRLLPSLDPVDAGSFPASLGDFPVLVVVVVVVVVVVRRTSQRAATLCDWEGNRRSLLLRRLPQVSTAGKVTVGLAFVRRTPLLHPRHSGLFPTPFPVVALASFHPAHS